LTPELKKIASSAIISLGVLACLITVKNEFINYEKNLEIKAQAQALLDRAEEET
jgi:hypothetical protein